MKRFQVISDRDNGVVFPPETVDREAARWRISKRKAAERIVAENTDPETDETLLVVRAQCFGD
jgi:hypothetical protein